MKIDIEELTKVKTNESFPNITVHTLVLTMPTVVQALEKGDMQLIIEHNGERKVPMRISESAVNIDRLLRTCGPITYAKSPIESCKIESVLDYLKHVCG